MRQQSLSSSPLEATHPVDRTTTLVDHIENLQAALCSKADAGLILRALDNLAQLARQVLANGQASVRSKMNTRWRSQHARHALLVAELDVFRDCFAADPGTFERGELYDFLTDWLGHAVWDDWTLAPAVVDRGARDVSQRKAHP